MSDVKYFGTLPSGEEVHLYEIGSESARLTVTDFGAAVVSLVVFGRDVVGGFDTLEGYLMDDSHQGGTIGRIANRVGGARFTMDGHEYRLPDNDNGNCLHGGCGFDRRVWEVLEHNADSVTLGYVSADGEEGFPARVEVKATYRLEGAKLFIEYRAVPDGKTPISMTNHTYFNLDGFGGTILDHRVAIHADKYTEVDESLIPTGNQPYVEGTVFDLHSARRIGDAISEDFVGYDHNFILEYRDAIALTLAAEVYGKDMYMSVLTDQPCIQFYIGNFLGNGPDFKGGIKQVKHGAFCLETQTEPNSVNAGKGFYDSGREYRHRVVYSFERL